MNKYVIVQKYRNKGEYYITYKKLENNSWRSKDIKNARLFFSRENAQEFLNNKYKYGGLFEIRKVD